MASEEGEGAGGSGHRADLVARAGQEGPDAFVVAIVGGAQHRCELESAARQWCLEHQRHDEVGVVEVPAELVSGQVVHVVQGAEGIVGAVERVDLESRADEAQELVGFVEEAHRRVGGDAVERRALLGGPDAHAARVVGGQRLGCEARELDVVRLVGAKSLVVQRECARDRGRRRLGLQEAGQVAGADGVQRAARTFHQRAAGRFVEPVDRVLLEVDDLRQREGSHLAKPTQRLWVDSSAMQIGKATAPVSHICQAYPDRVEVRGRDLCGDVMGRLSFSEYFYLLLTGEEPSEDQRYFLDLVLVAIAEHGMMPTNVAARMTLAADPESLQGAVAAGILGCGPVILGTAEVCARLLADAQATVLTGRTPAAVADEMARAIHAADERAPGFGHPVHRPLDPRAERILELADARGISGPHVLLAREFRPAVAAAWGKPLTMNVSLPIAAVMLDLGFPAASVKAIPVLARTAGLLAHLAEEQQQPIGFLMAGKAEEAISYEAPAGNAT